MLNRRLQRGATLGLVLSLLIVLIMIAGCFFLFSRLFGGDRELQNATDSGDLNVSKQALRHPGEALQGGEITNLAQLADPSTGQIDLLTYNRAVGKSLLVALNAQAEGTAAAKGNAAQMISLVNNLGSRLAADLQTAGNTKGFFTNIAQQDTVRMLDKNATTTTVDTAYAWSYMKAGTETNVDLAPQSIAPGATVPAGAVGKVSPNGYKYIAGYVPMQIGNIAGYITGVPLRPGHPPHLVSATDFQTAATAPANAGAVPPNAFKTSGAAVNSQSAAYAVVGSLNGTYTAAIPQGYLVFQNGPPNAKNPLSTSYAGTIASAGGGIFANELSGLPGTTQIWANAAGTAFCTSQSVYTQWANYNSGKTKTAPAGPAYGVSTAITGSPTLVTYADFALSTAMLALLSQVFPNQFNDPGVTVNVTDLMGIEYVKAQICAAFHLVERVHDPSDPHYQAHITALAYETALKEYSHSQLYPVPGQYPVNFGKTPASVGALLTQSNPAGSAVMQVITQRLYEIKPSASQAEINNALNAATLGMNGTMAYVYMDPTTGKLIGTTNPPPASWTVSGNAADGSRIVVSTAYQPNFMTIDGQKDGGSPVDPFAQFSGTTNTDRCYFTPSSGWNNLLGVVNFSNQVTFQPASFTVTFNSTTISGSASGGTDGLYWNPN